MIASSETTDVRPLVVVIASGKGGVGKSVLAVMLAARLAAAGPRVLLLDGAQNLGHLHVLLGVAGSYRLEQVQRGEVAPRDLVVPVTERLALLPADSGSEGLYAMPGVDQARLHHRLVDVYRDFDIVVVDAPGVEGAIRLAMLEGTRMVIVTAPEIGALTDAYALIKLVHAQLPALPLDVVMNRVEAPGDGRHAFERLAVATERFLGKPLGWLGEIPESPAMREATRRPGVILTDPCVAALGPHLDHIAQVLTQPPEPSVVGVVGQESPR